MKKRKSLFAHPVRHWLGLHKFLGDRKISGQVRCPTGRGAQLRAEDRRATLAANSG